MPQATPPLRLTDSELVSIIALTTPLAPHLRDQFLQALAAVLQGRELGPGAIHRAARAMWNAVRGTNQASKGSIIECDRHAPTL